MTSKALRSFLVIAAWAGLTGHAVTPSAEAPSSVLILKSDAKASKFERVSDPIPVVD